MKMIMINTDKASHTGRAVAKRPPAPASFTKLHTWNQPKVWVVPKSTQSHCTDTEAAGTQSWEQGSLKAVIPQALISAQAARATSWAQPAPSLLCTADTHMGNTTENTDL